MSDVTPAGRGCYSTSDSDNMRTEDALHRFDAVDTDHFPPGGIRESLDNFARCRPLLRIDAVSVQLFYADYQGLFYERPSTAMV